MYPSEINEHQREIIERQRQAAEAAREAATEQRIAQAADVSVRRVEETAVARHVEETVTVTRIEETVELQRQVERAEAVQHSEQAALAQRVQRAEDFKPEGAAESRIIGDPEGDEQFFHRQKYPDSCAVVAQESVLQKHTGHDFGEDALRREALEKGWLDSGTPREKVGNLLEAHGVPVQRWADGANMDILKDQISQGHDVIVGVDAGYLWQKPEYIGEGHAVWVTGIETDARTGQVTGVFANDSGRPDGAGIRFDISAFQPAWDKTGNHMISTM